VWTTEWVVIYPDGAEWIVVTIVELHDGRIRHETAYFAPPFEAPDWRREWVQRLPPG
jgi:hypothetical protein